MNKCSYPICIAHLALFGIMTFAFPGCRSLKSSTAAELPKNKVPFESLTSQSLIERLMDDQKCPYFSAQGQLEVDHEGTHFDAAISVKSVRDSACTISLKKLGIELSRVLISRDSFVLLDRTQQIYYSGSIEELMDTYHLPIDFYMLQDLLLSGYILIDDMNYELSNTDGYYVLKGLRESGSSELHCDPYTLRPMHFIIENNENRTLISALRYSAGSTCTIPSEWTIRSDIKSGHKLLKAHIEWSQVSTKALSELKFSIPKHYTRETR